MNRTELRHVVLYAKHWYKRSKDIWADIKKCLTADGFSGDIFDKNDCLNILVNALEKLVKGKDRQIQAILFGIRPEACWRYGYYTKEHAWALRTLKEGEELPDYNQDVAIVYYCFSHFMSLDKEEWNVGAPDFKNCLPRGEGITGKDVITHFGDIKEEVK